MDRLGGEHSEKMMSTWEFLQPWHAVLRESAVQPNCIAADASVRIELCCGVRVNVHTAAHSILIVVLVEEDSRRLREAIELFTLLSFVDNEAFVKLTTSPGYQLNGDFYVAKWRLFFLGALSASDATATETSLTWGDLLGCYKDPWEHSPEFRDAAHKIVAMGLEKAVGAFEPINFSIWWSCSSRAGKLSGTQGYEQSVGELNAVSAKLRSFPSGVWRDQVGLPFSERRCLFSACSAVAEMDSRPTLTSLCMKWMTSKRWPWLIYCLQCRASGIGATDTAVSTLTIRENQLTKADMSAIAAVLETRYPLPAGGEGIAYGFANVEEGAQLWPHGLPEHANNALVTSSKFRCRASYDAATNGGFVDLVVPGYGICKTRLGESTRFIPDRTSPPPPVKKNRFCEGLDL
ncbi:hypothetical protein PHYSODRAFT_302847 [Phytophthora sojae]|uniref:Uncharacterized protein n=1 Tax=Phytophthora sojae (strain P6497) TaxID=1094619 RepID=G4ZT66_PHYSP|nr:hypothetical protein PHYSODRAFT_302847 [Phytophthora sojae]EGZ13098.1 hypothetical protein PHYSODRAFT_302847 [Phytophthora sojae]|eukprot:XP_009530527.1 hypothetical protein PHYSODRAFT_302847 [Phytophthora sojae]